MNIPVVDQHQHWPMNKPPQLFDTYHRQYWDNEQVEHWENPCKSPLEDKWDQIMKRLEVYDSIFANIANHGSQKANCNLDMFKIDLLDIKQEPDEAATEFLEK
uniref:Uncharacterized protein n=1 Tax=Romanomermis culicivorax TaxID=13658 RepID=A0A915L2M7_ROMCU